MLFDEKLAALAGFDDLDERPEDKILIVLGNLDVIPATLTSFVRNGGAVLLASDRPLREPVARQQLLAVAGVGIGENTLQCIDNKSCYQWLFYCPYAVPLQGRGPDLFSDPVTGRAREVATNVPSYLVKERPVGDVAPIATLPDGCFFDGDERRFEGPGRRHRPLFAVAGDFGKGRALVMADHSVFINEMMLPTDNGNFDFTANAIGWLRDGRRTKVLFVDERGIQTKFEIPLKSINIPPEEAMRMLFANRNEILAAGENVLGRVEADGAFDRGLMNVLDRAGMPPGRIVLFALVILTGLFGLFAVYRISFRGRFHHDLTAPILATAIDRNLPVAALAEQRHRTLLAGGNLAEPAMHLARQWFARFGVEAFTGRMPTVEFRAGWWQRQMLSVRLRAVWRVAAGQWGRVASSGLGALERDLSFLRAAHARGEWRLSSAGIEG